MLKPNTGGPTPWSTKGGGPQPILTGKHRTALAQILEDGSIPSIHGVVRWRVINLVQWLFDEFQVSVSKQTLSRKLRNMGYRRFSARPRHHAQAAAAIEAFKKASLRVWTRSARGEGRAKPYRGLVR